MLSSWVLCVLPVMLSGEDVVSIQSSALGRTLNGVGVCISPSKGHFLTVGHLVESSEVQVNGKPSRLIKRLGRRPPMDYALIQGDPREGEDLKMFSGSLEKGDDLEIQSPLKRFKVQVHQLRGKSVLLVSPYKGVEGLSGSPVFTPSGEIVGLLSGVKKDSDIGVVVRVNRQILKRLGE